MRQMPWFRLYTEARTDAKLRSLSDEQFRVWFNLLCYAADQDAERGSIDMSEPFIVALEVSGGDEELLESTCHALSRLRMIECDGVTLTFTNFTRRQYDKPSDTPEQTRIRKQKSREKSRVNTGTSENVTPSHAQEKRREDKTRVEETRTDTLARPAHGRGAHYPEDFEKFWEQYPNKKAKDRALKAWLALRPSVELQATILAAIGRQRQGRDWLKDGGQFIPHPATWLNSAGWMDEVTPFTARSNGNGRASPQPSNGDISAANIDRALGLTPQSDGPYIETTGRIAS